MKSGVFSPAADFKAMVRRLRGRSSFVRRLIGWMRYAASWGLLLWGSLIHLVKGQTPRSAHSALVSLFAMSQGRANDLMAGFVQSLHPPYALPPASGVLGNLSAADLGRIEERLEREGYYVFENCLSGEFCDSVVRQSLEAECEVVGDEAASRSEKAFTRYNRAKPAAPLYNLTRDDTTDIREVQQLISDASLIAVAQNYLKAKPIFTGIYLGWSAVVKETPDSTAAQEFHWDMERIKWLRFFIYLTDVTADSGPHCFIKGTHRTGAIPDELLDAGYVRQRDERILQIYGQDAYREFTGPRGTIIAEDSRGFHKGKLPKKGDRLLLAFEISNTTFGANKRHRIRNVRFPQFGEFAKKYPRLYKNFDFDPGLV